MRVVLCLAPLTRESFSTIKHAVRDAFPVISSGHADEAVAFAFGFQTYASMLTVIAHTEKSALSHLWVSETWLAVRLIELGYDISTPERFAVLRRTLEDLEFPGSPEMARRDKALQDLLKPRPANDP